MRSGGGEKEWHEIKEKVQPRMKSVWQYKKWQTHIESNTIRRIQQRNTFMEHKQKREQLERKNAPAHISM